MAISRVDLLFRLNLALEGADALSGGPFWSGAMELIAGLTSGTTADKVDLAYMAERTIASATDDDIDVSGVLADALGNTLAVAELVGLFIINKQKDGTANTTDLTVGGGTNPVTALMTGTTPKIIPICPGGFLGMFAPDAGGLGAVVGGSSDILRVTNSSGAQNKYLIALLGRSA